MTGWVADAYYDVNFWLCMAGMTTWFSLRTEGYPHVPRSGPALLIANHQSFLDPVLVGLAARRRVTFLARKTLFKHWTFRLIAGGLNPVPVNQEGFAREGLKTILDQLERGRAVGIFPEGERTSDGQMHEFRPGIHLLIKRIEMPIVPVGIAGTFEAWPRWRPFPIPAPLFLPAGKGTMAVAIGRPISSACLREKPREQVLAELFAAVEVVYRRAEQIRRRPPGESHAKPGGRQFGVASKVPSSPQPQQPPEQNRE
jgi:1-acyl-sn-glycerol-3-phosphate acyltransferase